jgi:1,4-dihydroxy-2-naphthoyl-CoA hydrolase
MSDGDLFRRSQGFDAFYGLELLELGQDFARAELVVRDDHKQPFGLVHGGIYASIAEALASYSTASVVVPKGQSASGMSNLTSFLRPVTGGTIHALATCKHSGRTTWVWEVEMTDDARRLCATSRVTIAVRELPEETRVQLLEAVSELSD